MTIQVYGAVGCSQCEQFKLKLFREAKKDKEQGGTGEKFEYEYIMLDEALKEELATKFGNLPRSLPYIVNGDKFYSFAQADAFIKELKS